MRKRKEQTDQTKPLTIVKKKNERGITGNGRTLIGFVFLSFSELYISFTTQLALAPPFEQVVQGRDDRDANGQEQRDVHGVPTFADKKNERKKFKKQMSKFVLAEMAEYKMNIHSSILSNIIECMK
jgi:hypothetical protein